MRYKKGLPSILMIDISLVLRLASGTVISWSFRGVNEMPDFRTRNITKQTTNISRMI